jgi:hypothetical protein
MTRGRLLALNALVTLLGLLFAAALVREVLTPLPLPVPAVSRPAPPPALGGPAPIAVPPVGSGAYLAIVSKNLFSPSRAEGQGPAVTAGPKPWLHGVVMDGPRSRAYLEDPSAKRTYGYAVGDTVAGGRVQSINGDRVIIARPDGKMEVLLQDPDKPKPEAQNPAEQTTPEAQQTPQTPQAPPAAQTPTAPAPAQPAVVAPPRAALPAGAPAPRGSASTAAARRGLPAASQGGGSR